MTHRLRKKGRAYRAMVACRWCGCYPGAPFDCDQCDGGRRASARDKERLQARGDHEMALMHLRKPLPPWDTVLRDIDEAAYLLDSQAGSVSSHNVKRVLYAMAERLRAVWDPWSAVVLLRAAAKYVRSPRCKVSPYTWSRPQKYISCELFCLASNIVRWWRELRAFGEWCPRPCYVTVHVRPGQTPKQAREECNARRPIRRPVTRNAA